MVLPQLEVYMFELFNINYDLLPESNKWNLIRIYRYDLLKKSDWTQLPDSQLTEAQKTAWTAYRQALRDIPQTYQSPDDVIFPEKSS